MPRGIRPAVFGAIDQSEGSIGVMAAEVSKKERRFERIRKAMEIGGIVGGMGFIVGCKSAFCHWGEHVQSQWQRFIVSPVHYCIVLIALSESWHEIRCGVKKFADKVLIKSCISTNGLVV